MSHGRAKVNDSGRKGDSRGAESLEGGAAFQVTCSNCGATFAVEEPRCPYCGAMNEPGAEAEYMETLADIREDTDELAEEARRGFQANLRGGVKRALVITVAVVIAIAAIFFAVSTMEGNDEQRAIREYQAREVFREQHFPQMDALYDAGDADALSEYAYSLMDEPGFDAMYAWEHNGYLQTYNDYAALKLFAEESGEESVDAEDYTWAVSAALRLTLLDEIGGSSSTLPDADEALVADYREFAWQYLEDTLQMDEGEVATFADAARDEDGFVQRDTLMRNVESRLRELGTIQ